MGVLIGRSIQTGYPSMFRPHFIKPKTTVITKCIFIPRARKRARFPDTCKTAWTSEMFKWKGNLSESMKYSNSEKIRNSLDVHPSQKWLHEGTIYSHNEILIAVKSHRSQKYRWVKIARHRVMDSSHLWTHTPEKSYQSFKKLPFVIDGPQSSPGSPECVSTLTVGWAQPFGFANWSEQSSGEVKLN